MGVYFIKAVGLDRVKIGYTSSNTPSLRLQQLQTSSPDDLRVVLWMQQADVYFEKSLHRQFQACHINREWFRWDGEVSEFVKKHTDANVLSEPNAHDTKHWQHSVDLERRLEAHWITEVIMGRITLDMAVAEQSAILCKTMSSSK